MPAAAVDAQKILDLKDDLGEETVQELVSGFIGELDGLLARLEEANEAGEEEALRRAGHSIRSVCVEYGATALADLARAIEDGGPVDPAAMEACRDRTLVALKALVGLPA